MIADRQYELAALFNCQFGPSSEPRIDTVHDDPSKGADRSDNELLDRARRARNGEKFSRLYDHGDTSAYARDGNDGRSEADLALCRMLFFWTGPDPERIDRLFRASALMRDKWDTSRGDRTYGRTTIDKAIDAGGPTFGSGSDDTRFDFTAEVPETAVGGPSNGTRAAGPTEPTLGPAALHGLAGDIVRAIEPQTEADPAAVLLTLLVTVSAYLGPEPSWTIGGTPHPLRLWVVLVGVTSKGRKGTSFGAVRQVIAPALDGFTDTSTTGLSSGEGLIQAVRDPVFKTESKTDKKTGVITSTEVCVDHGVVDKRLLVREEELGRVLKAMGREGNTLSAVLRQAWDMGGADTLRVLTKASPNTATGAHIAVVGHITRDELLRYLEDTETANGFANRFLWASVRRSKVLPFGGNPDPAEIQRLGRRLAAAIATVQETLSSFPSSRLNWTDDGREAWAAVYGELSEGSAGLAGAVLSRAEAQVIRLAGLYAVLDGTLDVSADHLGAALAVWAYAEASARAVFGDRYGDHVADKMLAALKDREEMTRQEVVDLFARNVGASRIDHAVELLVRERRITVHEQRDTGGRPATVYRIKGAG